MSETCHEEGTVTGMGPGELVEVTVERGEACGSCEARGACQTLGGQTKDLIVLAQNRAGAVEGDRVRLTLEESAVVKASAVLYLVPAIGLIAGAAAGYAIASGRGWDVNATSAIGCLTGMISGFLVSRTMGKRMTTRGTFVPRITAITSQAVVKAGASGEASPPIVP
jgi:sigma-E factor negative regulatory protein RseC